MRILWVSLVALVLFACDTAGDTKIAAIDPGEGSLQGNQPVKILGSNFRTDLGYTVYFGNAKSPSVTILDQGTMVAVTPQRDKAGPVDVTVYSDDGSAYVLKQAFTFAEPSTAEEAGSPEKGQKLRY